MRPNARQVKELKLSVLRNLKLLYDLIDEASEIEYEKAPQPSSGGSRRTAYPPSDPTSDTALDRRRLGVRGAHETGIEVLLRLDSALLDATHTLAGAIERWQGESK